MPVCQHTRTNVHVFRCLAPLGRAMMPTASVQATYLPSCGQSKCVKKKQLDTMPVLAATWFCMLRGMLQHFKPWIYIKNVWLHMYTRSHTCTPPCAHRRQSLAPENLSHVSIDHEQWVVPQFSSTAGFEYGLFDVNNEITYFD